MESDCFSGAALKPSSASIPGTDNYDAYKSMSSITYWRSTSNDKNENSYCQQLTKRVQRRISLNLTSRSGECESSKTTPNSLKTPSTTSRKTPKTSSSSKVKSSDCGGFVLAITEGRGQARGEVGIASMDPRRPLLILCQMSDGQRYINSLTKMNVFDFYEVIIPSTFADSVPPSKLYRDIRSRFPNVVLTSVQRRHFNEALGLDLIKAYASPESTSVMGLIRDKFYALSAAAALIKYLEFTQNIHLAPQSLKIEYQGTEDTVLIDLDTANRLELVTCMRNPDANNIDSLMGVINHCRTKAGVRLLRSNILQPFYNLERIEIRLNCVQELVNDGILFCGLEAAITNFGNVENLLNLCMNAPQLDGIRMAEYQLKYTLLLKSCLEQIPQLISSLANGKSLFFRKTAQSLKDPRFGSIWDKISDVVFENARLIKGSISGHLHGCFAIKSGVNALLDVAKKAYSEVVQEITDHATQLREKYNLPLRLSFSGNKGFHLRCSVFKDRIHLNRNSLPDEFILVQKSKTAFTFYTDELVALDKRSQHVLNEIKLMTNAILLQLLTDLRPEISCLFNLCEIVAELDVIVSFAHISSIKNYVKPNFGCRLQLEGCKHPILDAIGIGKIVPNDVMAETDKNFMIITGPNQSGKSIYIRQVALLQIMSQIGCFVPAEGATFKLVNRIFSRIGFDDSIESNASTMMVEMRDIQYIRQNLTVDSLVIVDELCRGTSVEEGTHLAFAICEQLLDTSAFVFFTTHYLFLTRLGEMYPNVVNWHFDCELSPMNSGETSTRFTHRIKPGPTNADAYGLQAAEWTSFPKNVLETAIKISDELRQSRKAGARIEGLLASHKLAVELKETLIKYEGQIERRETKVAIEEIRKKYRNLNPNYSSPSIVKPSYDVQDELPFHFEGKKRSENGKRANGNAVAILAKKIRNKYRRMWKKRARQP